MRHPNPDGIIGSRPAIDLGPLFAHPTPEDAEAEIRHDFLEPEEETPAEQERRIVGGDPESEDRPTGVLPVSDRDAVDILRPAPAPRADEESDVFTGAGPIDHQDAVEKIQRAVREPLIALALERSPLPDAEAGVTAKDARTIADRKGLTPLLGQQQRAWSWLSTWLGQLAREGALVKYRRLDMTVKRMADNGNEHVVYLHPYDHRAQSAA